MVATGTPTFLVKQIRKDLQYSFDSIKIGEATLGNFDVQNILAAPLLFQTGYLTIKGHQEEFGLYELGYPNKEVESSLLDNLLSAYRDVFPGDSVEVISGLVLSLRSNYTEGMITHLNALIASISYDHWKAESESIFHIIVHLAFKKAGINIQSEVHSAKGRCDVMIFTDQYIYALELKLNGSAQAALDQIFEKQYLAPFVADQRKKTAVGVNFSSEKWAVENYLVQEVL